MKKLLLLLLLVPCVSAVMISDWPSFYVSNGKFNAIYVIGEEAPALDVVSATVISSSLAKFENVTTEVGTSRLDTEIANISTKDAIVVGSPCDNRAAYQLMGSPEPCYKDLSGSVGYIKLFQNYGRVQLLITGLDEKDRNAAAKFLANSNLKLINSTEFVINSNSGSKPQYFKKLNQTAVNQTVANKTVEKPKLNQTVTNVSTNVTAKVVPKNVSKPVGSYQPLEEIPQAKRGFFGRIWAWIVSLFT